MGVGVEGGGAQGLIRDREGSILLGESMPRSAHFIILLLCQYSQTEYKSRLTTSRYNAHRPPITFCPPGAACYWHVISNGSL